jgi:hypothetical protein
LMTCLRGRWAGSSRCDGGSNSGSRGMSSGGQQKQQKRGAVVSQQRQQHCCWQQSQQVMVGWAGMAALGRQ